MTKSPKTKTKKATKGQAKASLSVQRRPLDRVVERAAGLGTVHVSPSRLTGTRISRREMVGSVATGANASFGLTDLSRATPGYDFNPASSLLFPWLSRVAEHYEKYVFRKLRFSLVPSQPTSVAGRLYMAVDYDYDDPVATDVTTLMGNATSSEGPIWSEIGVTCDPKILHPGGEPKYTSTISRANFVEPRTAFAGFLMIATNSSSLNSGINIGDLWVDYDVDLMAPTLDSDVLVDTFGAYNITAIGSPNAIQVSATGNGYTPLNPSVGNAISSSVLPVVTPGQANTPLMALGSPFTSQAASVAVDMKNVTDGIMSLLARTADSGIAASAVVTKNPQVGAGIFDSTGSFLGDLSSLASTVGSIVSQIGYYDPSVAGTTGATALSSLAFPIAVARKIYPALRYLAPYIRQTTGATSQQYASSGWKLEL